METYAEWLSTIGSIAYFLAAIPALWISGRIILRNYAGGQKTTAMLLWLALGGLILAPMIDFLRYLSAVLSLIMPLFWNQASISVILGMGSFMIYSGITLGLGVVVYGVTLYYLPKTIVPGKLLIAQEWQLEGRERGFILLGIAGLVNQMVSGLVTGFVSIYLPSLAQEQDWTQLSSGFWISWVLSFLVLLVTMLVMNGRLLKREVDLLSQ